jgi:hypothetical protein
VFTRNHPDVAGDCFATGEAVRVTQRGIPPSLLCSRNVSEIELSRLIENGWAGVLNWLQNLDLLRVAGLMAVL